jgi:two-component system, OmpR family, sensor kinase
MTRRVRDVGLRGRLVASVVIAVGTLLVALVGVYNVVLDHRLAHEVNAILGARAESGLSRVQVRDGRVSVGRPVGTREPDTPLWIFAGEKILLRPEEPDAAADRAARSLVGGPKRFHEVEATERKLLAVPVRSHGRTVATVVTSVSVASYDHIQKVVLLTSVVLAALVLAAVALAAWWLVAGALRPVARMTAQAAEWSERDLERRFAQGTPHDELSQLAATLDELLDRVAAALRREQRFSAEVSHELRTPLAGIRAEAQLALRHRQTPEEARAGFTRVLRTADQMQGALAALMEAAHAGLDGGRGTSAAREGAAAAVRGCEGAAARRGLTIDLDVAGGLRVGARADLVERIVAPLLENACRYGRARVRVSAAAAPGAVVYTVQDDGPGVRAEEREAIFEPGARGTAADGEPGSGLGLALARRLARTAGGDVHAVPAADGGRFVAQLPRR